MTSIEERACTLPKGYTYETACSNSSLNLNITSNSCCSKKVNALKGQRNSRDNECEIKEKQYFQHGYNLWEGNTETKELCARQCYFEWDCKGWTWYADRKYCFVKSRAVIDASNDNAYSGYKCIQGCPKLADIPIKYDSKRLTCAWVYQSKFDTFDFLSCPESKRQIYPDRQANSVGKVGYYYFFGSVFVMPGCNLYVFEGTEGPSPPAYKLSGGRAYTDFVSTFNNFETGSYSCRCDRTPVNCEPEDFWQTVLVCDNSEGKDKKSGADCTYAVTTGATYSETDSWTANVGGTVEAHIEAEVGAIFKKASVGGSISFTAGYNWGGASTNTFKEEVTITMHDSVPKGFVLTVQQAVGRCGRSTFKTNMMKFIHSNTRTRSSSTQISYI